MCDIARVATAVLSSGALETVVEKQPVKIKVNELRCTSASRVEGGYVRHLTCWLLWKVANQPASQPVLVATIGGCTRRACIDEEYHIIRKAQVEEQVGLTR